MVTCPEIWNRVANLLTAPLPIPTTVPAGVPATPRPATTNGAGSSLAPTPAQAPAPAPQPATTPTNGADQAAQDAGSTDPEDDCAVCPNCDNVTAAMLGATFDRATAGELAVMATEINLVIDEAGLGSELRLAHFVGQCRQETAGSILKTENLNYSVSALKAIFTSSYGANPAMADLHGRNSAHPANQEAIANYAYAGRIGNGNFESGDGWRYRGRGIKQLTGRSNYRDFTTFHTDFWGETVDFEANPDLVATDSKYAVRSGIYFWKDHNLGPLADRGATRSAADAITTIINRYDGDAGYTNRYQKMLAAYNADTFGSVCFNTISGLSNSDSRSPK